MTEYAMGTVTDNYDQRSYRYVYRDSFGGINEQNDSIHPVVSLTSAIKVDASEGRDGKSPETAWKLTK